MLKSTIATTALAGVLMLPTTAHALEPYDLPVLNDGTSSVVSLDTEYRLGRNWARILRGQAPMLDDPLTYQYLQDLLWQLLPHSQVQDRRLELFVLANPSFNAFAVPGGVIGVHGGLILAAETEAELASVLAHELAHLSQRHYAQRLEEEKRNQPLMLAGILAGILVSAANTEGGMAVMSSAMGASAQNKLAFSRRNEQEADRVGMQTLVSADIDPHAMPNMFSRLQRSYQFYGQRPPEFLLTHPVTESRIADSLNRASQLPRPLGRNQSLEFELIKARMQVRFANSPAEALKHFQSGLENNDTAHARYGLMMAAMVNNKPELAATTYQQMPASLRQHTYVALTHAEVLLTSGQTGQAVHKLQRLLSLYPESRPARTLLAQALRDDGQLDNALRQFKSLSRDYPTDATLWFKLAETEGLAGNTLAVHEARIEYFMLTAQLDRALKQIEYARRSHGLTASDLARLDQRERETRALRQEMKTQF
ncbi:M48 family metalloprotease [Marinobacterium weihaiense]|uniref:Putative beta-barrel assembly-enhancing protease n=1 Tax=Marinobacterium weihaiense TaxID=2851016 RepID=A0ABS6M7E3_9GAMM|nr:M48 family metalloprotease [Marinobacterium weihaiense]MBV0932198.1 M48 family metalloprotease [Marinobacterium weihaiense]